MSKYYVSTTDEFLTRWGGAEGKINKLVFYCDSKEQAEIVAENAKNQGQTDIKIHTVRPQDLFSLDKYLTQKKTIEVYPNWYKENYFKPKPEPEPEIIYGDLGEKLDIEYSFNSILNVPKTIQKYFNKDKIKVFHNEKLTDYGISLTALRSVLTHAFYDSTDGYKKEYPTFREGLMFKHVDYATIENHGYIVTATFYSERLDYTIQLIVKDDTNGYKRGDIVG